MRHHHNWILKFGTRTLRFAILMKTRKFYRNIRNFFVCLESFPVYVLHKMSEIFYQNNQTEKCFCHIGLCHFFARHFGPNLCQPGGFVFPLEIQTF